ncbi:AbrB family transcriptional regulator [Microvirga arabica]|uniref:AbrB family transcriptional regulator n=1 Tax=Microvirga arabica TaxID=1128671 RepID=UPI00193A0602|nr:AbrB family transcriptional regulator [Microvirga arabica]MBM1175015.1 AbrB family transcriptional regulator [Microvirga arabica]
MRQLVKAFHAWGQAFSLDSFPYVRFLAALLVGAAGGWTFVRLSLPLPWMLGSMTACTVAALLRAPVAAPAAVRPPMTMIIGVMLGVGFTPQIIESVADWLPTVLGLAGFVLVSGTACVTYFRRIAGFDLPTAYFAGMPGGLVEMVIAGEEKGGDARTIALVHSARILLIVLTLPFLVQLMSGTALGTRPQLGLSIFETSWSDEVWLIATALAGALLGQILRLPARLLLGPMLVSAVVHVLGWTEFAPAIEIVNIAQLVLGTSIGCRFVGTAPREILRILALSLGSTVILLTITAAYAHGMSYVSSYGRVPLLLAYSPGGLAEMSLVALSLGIEVAFVAAHHIIRVLIVMVGAAPAFALLRRRK